MRITWFGHAAFLVEFAGTRIILDPYRSPDCGGFLPIDEPADLVVVSHENDRYHSHLGQIRPPFEVVRGLDLPAGWRRVRGLECLAIPCFESPEKLAGDEVTVLILQADGRRIVHLGDLGHALTDEEIEPLRGAEVVLAAAGGPPTIEYPELRALLDAIGPRVVIPMHYLVPGKIDLKIRPVERFLEAMADWPVEYPGGSSIHLPPDRTTEGPRIVRLDPAR